MGLNASVWLTAEGLRTRRNSNEGIILNKLYAISVLLESFLSLRKFFCRP